MGRLVHELDAFLGQGDATRGERGSSLESGESHHHAKGRLDMVSLETFRKLALELPGVSEQIHFGMNALAVGAKRFTAFDPKKGELALKLPLSDPKRLEGVESGILSHAPGKYGAEGWATLDMEKIRKSEFVRLLKSAHAGVAGNTTASKGAKRPEVRLLRNRQPDEKHPARTGPPPLD